ncbi:hypothetical protein ASF28_02860 [Methylobacterium sp. Leaf99]|nr:hypothetical protein ASF28_02860 [Methylobacterium sp. Leaf99]
MGLSSISVLPPSRGARVPDDRLGTLVDVDVLNGHFLAAPSAEFGERFKLQRVGAQKLGCEYPIGFELKEIAGPTRSGQALHRHMMRRGHLDGQHAFRLIQWPDALHGRQEAVQDRLRGIVRWRQHPHQKPQLSQGKMVRPGSQRVRQASEPALSVVVRRLEVELAFRSTGS